MGRDESLFRLYHLPLHLFLLLSFPLPPSDYAPTVLALLFFAGEAPFPASLAPGERGRYTYGDKGERRREKCERKEVKLGGRRKLEVGGRKRKRRRPDPLFVRSFV